MTEETTPTDTSDPGNGTRPADGPGSWSARTGRRLLLVGASTVLAAGAAAGIGLAGLPSTTHHSSGPGPAGLMPPARLTGAMVSFNGCRDYLSYVRGRAEAMAGPYGIQTSAAPTYPGGKQFDGAVGVPAMGAAAGGAVSGTAAGGMAGGAMAASGAAAGGAIQAGPAPAYGAAAAPSVAGTPASPAGFSHTNDQVAGVDEPDTVKTDGNLVVTLSGSTLRVLDPTARVLGSLQVAGDTGGGLVLDGSRALVFSSPATATPGTASAASGPAQPLYQRYPSYPSYSGPVEASPTAQAAVIDLSDPSSPQVVRTFHFAGSIVAARLVGEQVRLVLRSDGPDLGFTNPYSQGGSAGYSPADATAATAANRQLIASSTLTDWVPWWQSEAPDGAMTARQPVSSCNSMIRPDQATGISTVTVVSLDPQNGTPGPGTSVVAAGDTVYATADRLYVAGPSADSHGLTPSGQPYGCCSIAPPAGASTRIYAFDTPASGAASFAGEGTVPGWLVNSYAMDEDANGLLRVASTTEGSGGDSQSQITVLASSGGHLTAVGSVSGLGKGEFLRTVRFVGDRAYVVTFRTFDPLYVVDLSKPTQPVLSGALDQPGFSEFLYPLPEHRLLGVGVQLTDNEPSGLVVATYDVSNPAHPRRIDVSDLAQGFIGQGYDPHAFLYWAPAGLALLALPEGGFAGTSSGVAAYQIGSGGTLTRTATLGHGTLPATRSVVIGDQVWVTTSGGVVTSPVTDLPASSWHSY